MNRVVLIVSKRALSGLLVGAMLAGCAVGPDYKAPKFDLVPFHNAASVPAKAGLFVPPLDRWWTGFDDPMLVTIIQRALAENLAKYEATFGEINIPGDHTLADHLFKPPTPPDKSDQK